MEHSFHPGEVWLDEAGKPIQAHGFSVFYDEKERCYHWFGENKEFTLGGTSTVWTWGVRSYKSKDLYNWEDEGLIIPPTPEDLSSPLHPTYMMDRPHCLYCGKTGLYMMWLKIMTGNATSFMSVLASPSFLGPYHFVHPMLKPLAMDTGDFTLVEEKGKGYFIFERPHFELISAELNDTFDDVTGVFSAHYQGLKPPFTREAPTYFNHSGHHYLLTSGTSGYVPNPSSVCVFDDFAGEYRDLGNPCVDDVDETSFYSQFTCVLNLPNSSFSIAMADRWMPLPEQMAFSKGYAAKMAQEVAEGKRNDIAIPNYAPKKIGPLSKKLQVHPENISIARYVWLPLLWKGDRPQIVFKKEWRYEDYLH